MARGLKERLAPAILILRETASQWLAERAPRMAAALAFYTVFSLAPLLIIVVGIAGFFFGHEAAQARMLGEIEDLIGPGGARTVHELIESRRASGSGLLPTVIGIAAMLIGATGVFGELQDSLNTIWDVEAKPAGGILGIIRSRFVAFAMVVGIGFLLLVSLTVSAGLSAFAGLTSEAVPALLPMIQVVEFIISLAGITALFALLFSFVPDVDIAWRDVWPGAVVTALLFTLGKLGISLYIGHSGVTSAYGALGSLVVVLLWVYFSAQIMLFGAELTEVYATSRRRVNPTKGAKRAPRPEKARRLQVDQGGA